MPGVIRLFRALDLKGKTDTLLSISRSSGRRVWVNEKHETEDAPPKIYEEALQQPYPYRPEFDEGQTGVSRWVLAGGRTCSCATRALR